MCNGLSTRGASSWLTSLPLEEFSFTLHKGPFRDAIALRYGWQPWHTPTTCACGSNFSVEHALSCPKGSFPIVRHNEVRDLVANLMMSEVFCHYVCIDPTLQPITGEAFSRALAITGWDQPYSSTIAWIRCSLSFSLLLSSIQCIRGARSTSSHASNQPIPPIDLVSTEAKISSSL